MTAIHSFREETLAGAVAANVRAEAARRGYNQSTLAEAIGLARASVGARWRGEVQWQLEDIEAVSKLFNLDPASLLRTRRDSNSQPSDLESKVIDLDAYRRRVAAVAS